MPERRFSNRVEDYIRYRPSYPAAVLDTLRAEAGLKPASIIADVGSGTGISAELFLKAGYRVFGIEPNQAMRGAAERLLRDYPNFYSVNASAQDTTLSDRGVHLIVAAQAFHWFNSDDTRAEFTRILKPGGRIALLWNERKVEATPFLRDYEALLMRFGTDYGAVRHENIDAAALTEFFIGPYVTHTFSNEQRFDFEGLKGRLLSCSYAPPEGHERHEPMIQELRRIFDAHQVGGEVVFEYDTRLHLGQ